MTNKSNPLKYFNDEKAKRVAKLTKAQVGISVATPILAPYRPDSAERMRVAIDDSTKTANMLDQVNKSRKLTTKQKKEIKQNSWQGLSAPASERYKMKYEKK